MPVIECFYSAHSAFAWLGWRRLQEIAAETGRTIAHRPVMLDPLLEAVGSPAFRARSEAHVAYFFGREIQRWAETRGLRWLGRTPTHHHAGYDLANRAIIAAELTGGDLDALAPAFLSAHWERDADLSDRETLRALIETTGQSGEALLAAADGAEARARLEANTREAVARGVFGSPTYFADGDMFYGQDRLEMVARACVRAYAGAPAEAAG